MTTPVKFNLKIYQGSTFRQILRWETSDKVYVPIVNITRTAPMVVTATAHGAPQGWRVKISNSAGMPQANTLDYVVPSSVTQDTLTFNDINALNFSAYTTGGVLEYNQPVDLQGYTARMQIREKVTSETVIAELTVQNSGIILDNQNKTIQLYMSAQQTKNLDFKSAVYGLELESSGGEVFTMLSGSVTLVREVTR